MGDVSEEDIEEIHRVMAGKEPEPGKDIETEESAYRSAIEDIQRQEMQKRRANYNDTEWNALVPVLKGQLNYHAGDTDSNLSQLYSRVLNTLEDTRSFSRELNDFSRRNIVALGETPEGDELVLSEKRSKIRKKWGLRYRAETGRNISVEVKKDSLEEIDYRSEEVECARLRNPVVETQKRISSGIKELERKEYDTPAPSEAKDQKFQANLSLRGFKARQE